MCIYCLHTYHYKAPDNSQHCATVSQRQGDSWPASRHLEASMTPALCVFTAYTLITTKHLTTPSTVLQSADKTRSLLVTNSHKHYVQDDWGFHVKLFYRIVSLSIQHETVKLVEIQHSNITQRLIQWVLEWIISEITACNSSADLQPWRHPALCCALGLGSGADSMPGPGLKASGTRGTTH